MLTAEDRELLGIAPEPHKARRSSAVSQILRAIKDGLDHGQSQWDLSGDDSGQPGHQMFVAADRDLRRRAYALAHRVYHGCGYVDHEQGLIVSDFDTHSNTLTLLAVDDSGRDAATITLVFDSPVGLPSDEIYAEELDVLRGQGRRLVEVTRLAIDERHQRSKTLLVRLFNFIYIFALRVQGYTDFVIEVNPHHATYYRRLLNFEQVGPERPCPRVGGAPAVLLRVDLSAQEHEIRRVAGKGAQAANRTLFPHFYSWLEEGAVAEFLARTHHTMTDEDAEFFGLKLSRSTVSI